LRDYSTGLSHGTIPRNSPTEPAHGTGPEVEKPQTDSLLAVRVVMGLAIGWHDSCQNCG
jgi:hypothetical protein